MNKRRNTQFQKDTEEKKILALYREYNELSTSRWRDCSYIEVDPPIRNGWQRTFVLRPDVLKLHIGKYVAEALKVANVIQFSRTREFYTTKWEHPVRYRRKAKKEKREIVLKHIGKRELIKLSSRAQQYFYKKIMIPYWGPAYEVYVCDIPKWMLQVKVFPHYIRYFRIPNVEIESRYQEIRNYIDTHNLWPRINHLLGISKNYDDYDDEKYRIERKILKKDIQQGIESYFEEEEDSVL